MKLRSLVICGVLQHPHIKDTQLQKCRESWRKKKKRARVREIRFLQGTQVEASNNFSALFIKINVPAYPVMRKTDQAPVIRFNPVTSYLTMFFEPIAPGRKNATTTSCWKINQTIVQTGTCIIRSVKTTFAPVDLKTVSARQLFTIWQGYNKIGRACFSTVRPGEFKDSCQLLTLKPSAQPHPWRSGLSNAAIEETPILTTSFTTPPRVHIFFF